MLHRMSNVVKGGQIRTWFFLETASILLCNLSMIGTCHTFSCVHVTRMHVDSTSYIHKCDMDMYVSIKIQDRFEII